MAQDNPLLKYEKPLRTSYLVILSSVATADHENSDAEVAFIQQMASFAQLEEAGLQEVATSLRQPASINFAQHLNNIKNSDLKYALVADLINILYADGDMDQQELAQLSRINTALDISEEQFRVMSEYVKKANGQAAQQEGTPGLMGLMSDTATAATGGGMDLGGLLGLASNFLSQSGMQSQFQQAGIPTQNFESGSTVGTILTGLASTFIQSQLSSGGSAASSGGNALSGLMGSMLGGSSQPQTQSRGLGAQPSGGESGGLGNMVAGVLGSPQGQAMISGLLGQVMGSNTQGQGLSNMSSVLGGGKKSADTIGGLMNMFMQ